MARQKLDLSTQVKITKYLQSKPEAREAFASYAQEAIGGSRQSSKMQLANAVLGLPLDDQWFRAVSDWAVMLPSLAVSTLPPPPSPDVGAEHSQHLVHWMPGQVERRVSGTGQVYWRASDICERLGLRRDHATKHKGTLQVGPDYDLTARGSRNEMWLTKRGALKLIMRSREAGVPGSPLNELFNHVINVYVELGETGLIAHPGRAEAIAEAERLAAFDTQRDHVLGILPPAGERTSAELEAELRAARDELERLRLALGTGPP